MLRIGITGGMGSGKSTVARFFELLDIPVYYADSMAKRLMNENEALKAKISAIFGPEAYESGYINRGFIAQKAFSNPDLLKQLNNAVHPVVRAHGEEWMEKQDAPYVLKEAAILFESGANKQLDLVIGVYSPKAMRIQRIMQRDNIDEQSIMARINQQMDEEEKMKLCDTVIQNDENQAVIPQVLKLHRKLLLEGWKPRPL
jgi:dephospho-CoA kinase